MSFVLVWRKMDLTRPATFLIVAAVLLSSVAGAGLVAAEDLPSSTDGDIANGEILKMGEDTEDQVLAINYTFRLQNHQPGHTDGAAEHYAVGLPEKATLHRILLVSDDIGFSNCEPDNAAAFGIDRDNDDPGTNTDKSLLTAFKTYTSEEDSIDIVFYRQEQLAGKPVRGDVRDQIVAAQNNCYDNPSEPGWYRLNGTITGNAAGGTATDTKIRDLSNYVYVCDCSSRAEAEETLGPPPSESGDDGSGDGSSSGSTATATAAPDTATATDADSSGPESTATRTTTATATDTATATAAATATPTVTATPTDTATAQRTDSNQGNGGNDATATATETAASGGSNGGDAGGGAQQQAGDTPVTPTVGSGPGFGVLAGLLGAVLAGLLVRRTD